MDSPAVLSPFSRFLAAPDAAVPPEGPVSPLAPAVALATGVVGTCLFAGALLWATGGSSGDAGLRLPAFLLSVPLAQVLCFPPLYLWTALRGVSVDPLRLAGAAAAGPGAVGAWLGSVAPIFLLYGLTGPAPAGREWDSLGQVAIGLLGVACVLAGLFIGARNAVRSGAQARLPVPGAFVLVAHFFATTWTTLVLVARLGS